MTTQNYLKKNLQETTTGFRNLLHKGILLNFSFKLNVHARVENIPYARKISGCVFSQTQTFLTQDLRVGYFLQSQDTE